MGHGFTTQPETLLASRGCSPRGRVSRHQAQPGCPHTDTAASPGQPPGRGLSVRTRAGAWGLRSGGAPPSLPDRPPSAPPRPPDRQSHGDPPAEGILPAPPSGQTDEPRGIRPQRPPASPTEETGGWRTDARAPFGVPSPPSSGSHAVVSSASDSLDPAPLVARNSPPGVSTPACSGRKLPPLRL